MSLILATGEEGTGLLAMHSCVNPRHLSWGSVSDNAKDALNKGRLDMEKAWAGIRRQSHCKRDHELSPENTYADRTCKACHAMRAKKYRAKANETRRAWRARKRIEMKAGNN